MCCVFKTCPTNLVSTGIQPYEPHYTQRQRSSFANLVATRRCRYSYNNTVYLQYQQTMTSTSFMVQHSEDEYDVILSTTTNIKLVVVTCANQTTRFVELPYMDLVERFITKPDGYELIFAIIGDDYTLLNPDGPFLVNNNDQRLCVKGLPPLSLKDMHSFVEDLFNSEEPWTPSLLRGDVRSSYLSQ